LRRGNILQTRGVAQMRTFALFGVKNYEFFKKIFPHRQGKEVKFSRFCADIFYGLLFREIVPNLFHPSGFKFISILCKNFVNKLLAQLVGL